MKKNLKHLLALCLTLALVFSLAACGQKADETPNDAQKIRTSIEFPPSSSFFGQRIRLTSLEIPLKLNHFNISVSSYFVSL